MGESTIRSIKNHTHKYVKHTQKIFANLTEIIFNHKKLTLACTILTPVLFICLFSCNTNVVAASYVAQYVGAAVNGTWVKVNTSGPVNIDIVPTATGTLGINKSEVSVETNANTGYRLYLSGINSESNGYTALYRNGNPSDTSKFTSVTSEPTSPTSLTNGQWGWALPASAAGIFPAANSYSAVANTGSTVEPSVISNLKFAGIKQNYTFIKSTNTSNESNPDNLDIYYGALADNSMTIGSYYNVIVYTAFVEGSDTISVSPSQVADGDTMTVATNIQGNANPITPEQVEIALYDPSDETKNIGTCDNISIPSEHNGTVGKPLGITCVYHRGADATLYTSYAVKLSLDPKNNGIHLSYDLPDSFFIHNSASTLADTTYMQDVTSTVCDATPTWEENNTTYALTDYRDNKKYLIRKLADGRCWMVQNLALGGNMPLSFANSDLPQGETYVTPDGETYADKFTSSSASHMWNGLHVDAQNDGFGNNGAYYNANVATAGSTIKASETDRSVCPQGWKLPSNDDYSALKTSYDSDKTRIRTAWNMTMRTGSLDNGTLRGWRAGGYWWSGSLYDSDGTSRYLYSAKDIYYQESDDFYVAEASGRFNAYTIRCIAKR